MLKNLTICFSFCLLSIISCAQSADKAQSRQAIPSGSLLIMGGGQLDTIFTAVFGELAGGKDAPIVLIPTASSDEDMDVMAQLEFFRKRGFTDVSILHTRTKQVADSKEFVKPLKRAMGVWISGGRQWRLSEAYLNTRTHTELDKLLRRGGVIAGTSAGATIQGSVLVRGAKPNNTIMLGDNKEGFGFLENVGIDQHLLKRNRQFDMFEVLNVYPNMLGIGIDENTGILVQDSKFKVLGESYVAVYDGTRYIPGEKEAVQLAPESKEFYFLKAGELYDIKKRKVIQTIRKKDRKSEEISN